MTHGVITVQADATVQDAARLMLESGVRAAPVVDSAGKPIGMVSDGDLLGRRPEDYRREWWLEMLAGSAGHHTSSARSPPAFWRQRAGCYAEGMSGSHSHFGNPRHAPRDYAQTPVNIYWEMTQACPLACRHSYCCACWPF